MFYNGLNSQLPTYLAALKQEGNTDFFGAMYLEMAEPIQSLQTAKTLSKAIIQPGGSVRDQESIEAADKYGLTMIFTGVRHFRH